MATAISPLSVMLVDDDEDALVLTRHLVEKAEPSATVIAMQSARAAMGYLLRASHPVDGAMIMPAVILLDLNMPEMNGLELLRWIRHNRALAGLKVVMLSSSEAGSDIKKANELGAHGYLIKYPNVSCLASLLKQATGSKTPFPATPGGNGSSSPVASTLAPWRPQTSGTTMGGASRKLPGA